MSAPISSRKKIILPNAEAFQQVIGQRVGPSEAIEISQQRIEQFCMSVGNTEWIHWDHQRCLDAGLAGTIMPGFMGPALFSQAFFDMVDVSAFQQVLFSGTDRVRLLRPVVSGSRLAFHFTVTRVDPRERGISVHYEVQWHANDEAEPAGIAAFIIRYW